MKYVLESLHRLASIGRSFWRPSVSMTGGMSVSQRFIFGLVIGLVAVGQFWSPPRALAVHRLTDIFKQAGDGEEFMDPDSSTEVRATLSSDRQCRHTGPYGMAVMYDVRSDQYAVWGVEWEGSKAGRLNASEFSELSFWVKDMSGGADFKVGMRDLESPSVETELNINDVTTLEVNEWTQVRIDLVLLKGLNMSNIDNINFTFSGDTSGAICIDDIELN